MDDLLREFLVETAERLEAIDAELVRFERDPTDVGALRHVFRLVHTIMNTCGFLGLPRLEALAHAAETLMGYCRDGASVEPEVVTLVLATLDRLKGLLASLEAAGTEPEGADEDLVEALVRMAEGAQAAGRSGVPHLGAAKLGSASLTSEANNGWLEAASVAGLGPVTAEAPTEMAVPATRMDAASEWGRVAAWAQTVRVDVAAIEHLMTMVSELVLTRNQLLEVARVSGDDAYKVPLQRLSHVTAELQEGVMKTRMQPIGNAWQKLPRVVRDLSAELGKQIELVMVGAETELDRQVLDVIKDPLTHMVRNSADHGLEATAVRVAAGKPARGTIRLSAYHEGGTITIEIADDGKGLDLAAIRRKAVERGLASQSDVEKMTDAQVAKFIFDAGFSTAAAVTSVSGRGVGMDVVKTNIETIGGVIDINTQAVRGTTFTIKIPLTLAIVAALVVRAGDSRFALPQVAVLELVRVDPSAAQKIERINGAPVLRLRERLLPIVTLTGLLGQEAGEAEIQSGFVVVAQVGRQRFGILVDEVFHTEEIVVKPMSTKLRHLSLFAGNTILGDGAVVLIIDPNGVADKVAGGTQQDFAPEAGDAHAGNGGVTQSYLVFQGGSGPMAVPLSLVTRLETVDAGRIEWPGGRPVIQYRGRLMPLVSAEAGMSVRRHGSQDLLVFSVGGRPWGLLVDRIVDVVSERVAVAAAAERPGILGTTILRGRATEIIDVAHLLPFEDGGVVRRVDPFATATLAPHDLAA